MLVAVPWFCCLAVIDSILSQLLIDLPFKILFTLFWYLHLHSALLVSMKQLVRILVHSLMHLRDLPVSGRKATCFKLGLLLNLCCSRWEKKKFDNCDIEQSELTKQVIYHWTWWPEWVTCWSPLMSHHGLLHQPYLIRVPPAKKKEETDIIGPFIREKISRG